MELLFQTKKYLEATEQEWNELDIYNKNSSLCIKFFEGENKNFICGHRSTFGSISFRGDKNDTSCDILCRKFFKILLENYDRFELRVPPKFYDEFTHESFARTAQKFPCEIVCETNQYINLSENKNNYFSKTNSKMLRRLVYSGFTARILKNINPDGFYLLQENRAKRGVELSLSYDQLLTQVDALPDRYRFVECCDSSRNLVAYAVFVRINSNAFYVLYWGENFSFRKYSPVVLMCDTILKYCQNKGVQFLDLGISSLHGNIDQGLFEFKERLGALSCPKLIIYNK